MATDVTPASDAFAASAMVVSPSTEEDELGFVADVGGVGSEMERTVDSPVSKFQILAVLSPEPDTTI
jgi:hypothetical protein